MDKLIKVETPKQIKLEKFKVGAMGRISEQLAIEFANFDLRIQRDMTDMILDVRAIMTVLGVRLETIKVQYPDDWKEAFKERWFPAWALKRWPVRYRTYVMEARALYPKLPMPVRGFAPELALVVENKGVSDDRDAD